MFATPALPPRNVLKPGEYHFGPRRFKLDTMDRVSFDSFNEGLAVMPPSGIPNGLSNRSSRQRQSFNRTVRNPAAFMTAGLKRHFEEAQFSDLVVRCREDEYHVHRVIMCSQSQWFSKVCDKAIISGDESSSGPQCIDLSADDPDAVDAMLQYCYQLDYADKFLGLSSAGYTIYTLTPHIDICLLAERYSIPGLKQLAMEKFEQRASVLARVELNKDKFFQAIRIIYASSRMEGGLKKVAVKLCADHAEQYMLQGGKTAQRVFGLMDEVKEFRVDLIKEMASRLK